jgi:hypothetical protein
MLKKSPPQKSRKLVVSRETLHSLHRADRPDRPEWLQQIQGGNSPRITELTCIC